MFHPRMINLVSYTHHNPWDPILHIIPPFNMSIVKDQSIMWLPTALKKDGQVSTSTKHTHIHDVRSYNLGHDLTSYS